MYLVAEPFHWPLINFVDLFVFVKVIKEARFHFICQYISSNSYNDNRREPANNKTNQLTGEFGFRGGVCAVRVCSLTSKYRDNFRV